MSITDFHTISRKDRLFTEDEETAIETVFQVAVDWREGRISKGEALSINPCRGRGLALMYRTSDPRIEPLRALSEAMSETFGKVRLSDGTMMDRELWEGNERLVSEAQRSNVLNGHRATVQGQDRDPWDETPW